MTATKRGECAVQFGDMTYSWEFEGVQGHHDGLGEHMLYLGFLVQGVW